MKEHWAVIPVKGLAESKTRLSSYLGDKKRFLVKALLQDVLSAVFDSNVYDRIFVISPDTSIAGLVREGEASFLRQTGYGLNRAVEQANRLALRESSRSMTTILADIPLAEPEDFQELFNLGYVSRKIVLAPSLKGGTNIMMVQPPGLIRPSYGRWSYSRHLRQAQLNGVVSYSISNSRVSLDIDTVDDLSELRRRDSETRTSSGMVLDEIGSTLKPVRVPVSRRVTH